MATIATAAMIRLRRFLERSTTISVSERFIVVSRFILVFPSLAARARHRLIASAVLQF